MLQSLGISADAEAVYVVLAQRGTATTEDLAETSTAYDAEGLQQHLRELVGVGLAAELCTEGWRALPLLDGVRILRERREAELRAATAAAESLQNHLLAAARNQSDDDSIIVLLGTEAIIEARDGICDAAKKEICASTSRRTWTAAADRHGGDPRARSSPEWQALERGIILRCVYHPGFDSDRLAELACSPRRASSRGPPGADEAAAGRHRRWL